MGPVFGSSRVVRVANASGRTSKGRLAVGLILAISLVAGISIVTTASHSSPVAVAAAPSPFTGELSYNCPEGVCIVDLAAQPSNRVLIGGASNLSWSPDGTKAAYNTASSDGTVIVVAEVQGETVEGPPSGIWSPCNGLFPSWSPSGDELAASSAEGDVFTFTFDLERGICQGSGYKNVTPGRMASRPVWSPDGDKLAFSALSGSASRGLDWDIWVLDSDWSSALDPPQEQVMNTGPAFWELDPTWSPDGTHLAYRSCRTTPGEPGCNRGSIRIESIGVKGDGTGDASTARTLTDPADSFLSTPAYSPDGTMIAFTDVSQGIMVMNADGSGLVHVPGTRPGDHAYPQWRPSVQRPEDSDVYSSSALAPQAVFEFGEGVWASLNTLEAAVPGADHVICVVPDGQVIQPACQPQESNGVWVGGTSMRPVATTTGASLGKNLIGPLPSGRYRIVVEEVPFRSPGVISAPLVVKCAGKCGRPAALPKISAQATADGMHRCLTAHVGTMAVDLGMALVSYGPLFFALAGGFGLPAAMGVVGGLIAFESLSGFPLLSGWSDVLLYGLGLTDPYGTQSRLDRCNEKLDTYEQIADDPPDPNFTELAIVDESDFLTTLGTGIERFSSGLALGVAYEEALLHSLERMQGAQLAGNDEWTARQMAAAIENSRGLAGAERMQARGVDEILAAAPDGWGEQTITLEMVDATRIFRERLASSGFSAAESQALADAGLDAAQIAEIRGVIVAEFPPSESLPVEAVGLSLTEAWVDFRNSALAAASAFDSYSIELEAEYTGLVPNPVAHDQQVEAAVNDSTAVTLYAHDPDDAPLTYAVIEQPAHGVLAGRAPRLRYTPDEGYTGHDSFTFSVSNGSLSSEPATVSIDVLLASPEGTPDEYGGLAGQPMTVPAPGVLANDLGGAGLSPEIVRTPSSGTVQLQADGSFVYEPNAGPLNESTDSFTYRVRTPGSAASDPVAVTLTLADVNDVPDAAPDRVTTEEDVAVGIAVLANDTDADGDPVTLTGFGQPVNGRVDCTASVCTYTPAPNFSGTDEFVYHVSDSHGGAAFGLVSVEVIPVPDGALAADDQLAFERGLPGRLNVLLNDDDADGDSIELVGFTQPGQGVVSIARREI